MQYVSTSFGLNMVKDHDLPCLSVSRVPEDYARSMMAAFDTTSVVGREDMARVLGVERRGASLTLERGDTLYVALYSGLMLPDGATTVPVGESFRWLEVALVEYDVQAVLSLANNETARWGADRLNAYCAGIRERSGYAVGYTLGASAYSTACHADAYECAIGRVQRDCPKVGRPDRTSWLNACRLGFVAYRRDAGCQDDAEASLDWEDCMAVASLSLT